MYCGCMDMDGAHIAAMTGCCRSIVALRVRRQRRGRNDANKFPLLLRVERKPVPSYAAVDQYAVDSYSGLPSYLYDEDSGDGHH